MDAVIPPLGDIRNTLVKLYYRENGKKMPLEYDYTDGCIFKDTYVVRGKCKIMVEVNTMHGFPIYAFDYRQEEGRYTSVQLMHNMYSPENPLGNGAKKYHKYIEITVSDAKHYDPVDMFDNILWIISLGTNGKVKISGVGIVTQKEHAFLTIEECFRTKCYRDGQKVVCPKLEGIKGMDSLIEQISSNLEMGNLKPLSSYQAKQLTPTITGLAPQTGIVHEYCKAKNYGTILTFFKNEVVRAAVDWTHIQTEERFRYLVPGQIVKYDALLPKRLTLRGLDIPFEATEVALVSSLKSNLKVA